MKTGPDLPRREPDAVFIARTRLSVVKKHFIDGPPDLVVEVLSPDNERRDPVMERRVYGRGGVREYWIVGATGRPSTFLARCYWNAFDEIPLEGPLFRSCPLPGLSLDTRLLRPD